MAERANQRAGEGCGCEVRVRREVDEYGSWGQGRGGASLEGQKAPREEAVRTAEELQLDLGPGLRSRSGQS